MSRRIMRNSTLNAALLTGAILLTGCARAPVSADASPPGGVGERLLSEGRYLDAAQAFQHAGAEARGRGRDLLLLGAAEAWRLAGDVQASGRVLAEVNGEALSGQALARYRLLRADQLLRAGRDAEALALLGDDVMRLPVAVRPFWHRTRATALAESGRPFAAAGELARIEIEDAEGASRVTRDEIDRLLAQLDDAELQRESAALPIGDPLYRHAGSVLARRGLPLPRPFETARYRTFAGDRAPAEPDGYRPASRLAVLLPLSGPLAGAGTSVRDGILSAYFGESRRRPELRFYDTEGRPERVVERYREARADGAGQIIGPLSRDEVAALHDLADLPVPVLALNRAGRLWPPGHVVFSLSPEEEAIAAAERLLRKGLTRVVVVGNGTDAAERGLSAFGEHFVQRGGHLLARADIDPDASDYSGPLGQAFTATGVDGPDALFLALRGPEARLLVPQLAVAGFQPRPMLASSQIQLGTGNPRLDRELDGIEFPDLAWPRQYVPGLPDGHATPERLSSARGGGTRLFALGMDAFRLSGYLERLLIDPGVAILGATGELRLDAFGNVIRRPAWTVFRGGRLEPVSEGGLHGEALGGASGG